ncbi:MAG: serine/threonine-protein kinase [Planctomycetota bacterium]
MVAASDTVGAPTPPRFLGDFELLREIGRGGMAVVYLARQRSLDRVIALKLLPLERTASSRDIERFYREATLVAKLHHQNVVPVHAVGEVMGSHFIAMDFIAGPSLAEILEAVRGRVAAEVAHGPFPWPADGDVPRPGNLGSYIEGTCRIAAGIARALAHAHDQGVIHRDVKPGNILIDASGVSLLTDFGLAHVDGSATLTLSGDFAGTPYYVSPEQIEPRRGPIDGRSDVYALGATLYQMLTLRPPFEGVTPVQIFRAKLIGEPLPARRLNPSLPRDLETIVHHCLEREPGDRYATASELADDLERFLSYLPIRARRTASWLRAVKLARRHRGTVATAIGAAVVMAVILFALRVHERGAEARSQDARRIAAIAAIDAAIDHGDLVAAEAALGDVVRFASPTELTRNRQRVDALRAASLLDQARQAREPGRVHREPGAAATGAGGSGEQAAPGVLRRRSAGAPASAAPHRSRTSCGTRSPGDRDRGTAHAGERVARARASARQCGAGVVCRSVHHPLPPRLLGRSNGRGRLLSCESAQVGRSAALRWRAQRAGLGGPVGGCVPALPVPLR